MAEALGMIECRSFSAMVEAAERNDFDAARQIHTALMPLMTANFVESNPIPVKSGMAAMGLLEESYRLPLVPPGAAAKRCRWASAAGLRRSSMNPRRPPYSMLKDTVSTTYPTASPPISQSHTPPRRASASNA